MVRLAREIKGLVGYLDGEHEFSSLGPFIFIRFFTIPLKQKVQ